MKKYLFSLVFMPCVIFSAFGQQYSSYKDARDGKVYKTVIIGNQEWMAENLNTDRFRNGDKIPEARSIDEWIKAAKDGRPAWCYYNNDPKNAIKFGKLYNIFAIMDKRGLPPSGSRIPYKSDFMNLLQITGGDKVSTFGDLKSKNGWTTFGNGTDFLLFNLYPSGFRYYDGKFGGSELQSSLFSYCDSTYNSSFLFTIYYKMNTEFDTTCNPIIYSSSSYDGSGYSIRTIISDIKNYVSYDFTPTFSYPIWFDHNLPVLGREINLSDGNIDPDSTKHIGFLNYSKNLWEFSINNKMVSFKIISNKEVNSSRECVFMSGDFKIITRTYAFSSSGREAGALYFYFKNNLLRRTEIIWDL
jgi:uncharacterized protein (TIGR02145 family)